MTETELMVVGGIEVEHQWRVGFYPIPPYTTATFEAMADSITQAVNHPASIFSAWDQDVMLWTEPIRRVVFAIDEPLDLRPSTGMPETLTEFQDIISLLLAGLGLEGEIEADRVVTLRKTTAPAVIE